MLSCVGLQLERLKSENTATVAVLTSHLQSLWDRVDLPHEDRCQFLAANSGVSQRVVHSVKSSMYSSADVELYVVYTLTVCVIYFAD